MTKQKFLLTQYLIGGALLLTVLSFSFLYVITLATSPYQKAKEKTQGLAKTYANLKTMDSFSFYNGKESYESLLGVDKKGKKIAVLVAEKSDQIRVYQLDQGIDQKKAKKIAQENGAKKVDQITFGYEKDQPIWEIRENKTYYLIAFETGQLLAKEEI